jgi:hypothetical protein
MDERLAWRRTATANVGGAGAAREAGITSLNCGEQYNAIRPSGYVDLTIESRKKYTLRRSGYPHAV